MLYPKIYKIKKNKKSIECLEYLKENILGLFQLFCSFHSIALFIQQKFHF